MMDYTKWVLNDVEHFYIQIENDFRIAIFCNELPTGERMPSVRELSILLKVNENVVRKAYRELVKSGLIEYSCSNHQYAVTKNAHFIANEKENATQILCCNYIRKMVELGYGVENVLNILSDYAGQLKI